MPGSINCKDLPYKSYYCAENGIVRLDRYYPTPETIYVQRDGDKLIIDEGLRFKSQYDLSDRNHVKVNITDTSFMITDTGRQERIYKFTNVPKHKHFQLEELKKLIG